MLDRTGGRGRVYALILDRTGGRGGIGGEIAGVSSTLSSMSARAKEER